MTTFPCTNYRRHFVSTRPDGSIRDYELNITARNVDGNPSSIYAELITKTVKLWLYLAVQIEAGVKTLPPEIAFTSVEGAIENEKAAEITTEMQFDHFLETRVAVFDWNYRIELTLHSSSLPQPTLDLYWAMEEAKGEFAKLYPIPQTNQGGSPQSAGGQSATNTPPPPANPVEGVIVATRLPTPNSPQYADGQLVSFTITKIEAGADKGSATFKMWSSLGGKWATHTVYKLDTKGQPNKSYEIIIPVLNTIKLDFEHPEAQGSWNLVVKAAHVEKNGKTVEYLNTVSLTPI